jgi:hypothetical protein
MLQSSSGGPARSHEQLQELLVATTGLAVAAFSRLFAAAIERIGTSSVGHVPGDLANGSITTQGDLSASLWLGEQGARLVEQFGEELKAQAELFCAGPVTTHPTPALTLASLEQLGFEETEVLVTLRSLAQWVETLSHEEFYLFNHRLGYLSGQFALPPARNPFSPGRVFDAFDGAGKRLVGYAAARLSLLRLLRRAGLEGAVAVYSALNQFLLEQGVLPRFRPRIRRELHEEDARLRAIGPITEELERLQGELQRLADDARRRVDPHWRSPRELAREEEEGGRASRPLATGEPGKGQVVSIPRADWRAVPHGAPRPVRRAAESLLDVIRSSAAAARIGRGANALLQVTNFAFGQLLVAPQLATPMRLLLSRLQGVFYRAAIVDHTVMSKRPHPVRSLVNRLSEAGIAWSAELGEQDSLYLAMFEIVERLNRPARDEIELFGRELEQFDRFIAVETHAAKQAAALRARDVYQSERNRVAYATAATEVDRAMREDIYPPLPEFAERFVRETWVHTLRDAYVREGKEGEAWKANLDFLHELTWSLKPKPSDSERRILLRMLPELVQRIQSSLAFVDVEDQLRGFLSDLMQAHLFLVRGGVLPRHLRGAGLVPTPPPRVDYQQVLERLDPNLARRAPPPTIQVGTWVEFGTGASVRYRKRLVWISPLSHRALFTNRRGEGELVLTPDEVGDKLAAGQLTELRYTPLFERSLRDAKLRLGEDFGEPEPTADSGE